jgi:hypothetical protein
MTKLKFLILKLDMAEQFKEAETISQLIELQGTGGVEVVTASCDFFETALTKAKSLNPTWIHLIVRADENEIFSTDSSAAQISKVNRIELIGKLREGASDLRLVSLNSKLDERDLENFGDQLYGLVGMKDGYHLIAGRQFFPKFYNCLAQGQTLAEAFQTAQNGIQDEVKQHQGTPAIATSSLIDIHTFTFVGRGSEEKPTH